VVLWVKVWPKTAAGRRMILGPVEPNAAAPVVRVGQAGVTASELRPMGVCDFGAERVEARAERGTIPKGRRVEVIALVDGRPTVRPV
jgi:membrane-bound ClpP family serine protease